MVIGVRIVMLFAWEQSEIYNFFFILFRKLILIVIFIIIVK